MPPARWGAMIICACQTLHESVVCVPGYDYGLPASSPCGTYGAHNLCGADGSAVAMEGLRCTGAELTLSECTWASPSTACRSHEHDSIIFCGSSATPAVEAGDLRLLSEDGAPSLSGSGIVEIFSDGEWSSVCGLNSGAASVICKNLGFASAGTTTVGRSSSAPQVGALACKGSEASVLGCSFSQGEDVYCARAEAAVVQCV